MGKYQLIKYVIAWAILATFVTTEALQAQQFRQPQSQSNANQARNSLVLPGSPEVMRIEVMSPDEVRVGQSYEYRIQVTNLTQDLVLHQVTLEQQVSDGFYIESSQLLREDRRAEQVPLRSAGGISERAAQPPGTPPGIGDEATRQRPGERQAREEDDQQGGEDAQMQPGENQWTIPTLGPGETRTVSVTATSDKEGVMQDCIMLRSFTPALCTFTRFIRPELEVVKIAPATVNICEQFEYEYLVKNEGSGATPRLTIRDALPEGLTTASGQRELEFTVDGLQPDETRKFVAQLRAERPGEYTSRAVVIDADGSETRSGSLTTRVVHADLVVAIDGPATEYPGRQVSYNIRVTNHGDVEAPDSQLALFLEENMRLLDASEPRPSSTPVSEDRRSESQRPTNAPLPNDSQNNSQDNQDNQQGNLQVAANGGIDQQQALREFQAGNWQLGTILPGETREVRVTLQAREGGEYRKRAVASYICSAHKDEAVQSLAFKTTEIIAIPALLVAVVDETDPVRVGENVFYQIIVENQGTGEETNIEVIAELPEQVSFVGVEGPSNAEADGQTLNFGVVERLAPGETIRWRVQAHVDEPGEVRFEVVLDSESMSESTRTEEPTRLVQAPDGE